MAEGERRVRAELEGVDEAEARGLGRLSRKMELVNTRLVAFARRAGLALGAVAAAATASLTRGETLERELVPEHAEYQHAAIEEAQESYRAYTYGRVYRPRPTSCAVWPLKSALASAAHISDLLLKDEGVALILGISVPAFWRRVADGTLPKPIKLGAPSRWPRSEILSVIEGTKAGLREHEREKVRGNRAAFQSWQNAQALWKADHDGIMTRARSAKAEKRTGCEADRKALGPEPAAPPSADRVMTEPTWEGLTRLFATGQPSLVLMSDEGG